MAVAVRQAPEAVGFAAGSAVVVRQDGDSRWVTLRPLVYHGARQRFEVPAGTGTDFASVPRPFVWFLPRYGRYTMAAILHDHLCVTGIVDRADADGVFRQAMRTLGVPFLRRWIMWAAVRLGALTGAAGRRRWFGHAWQIVPVALLALPIVLPPAVLVVLALGVFHLVELAAWLLLLAGRLLRGALGEGGKRVNRPRLRWRL
ncbi:MAG TPA: DUF1353 domain-containing protein [Pseudonocardiaceae bacterium]